MSSNDKKLCQVKAYVTEDERASIARAAQEQNITVSEFIKRRLLMKEPRSTGSAPQRILTVEQIADYLLVSRRKARQLCESRQIPCFKAGSQYRATLEAVDKYIAKEQESYHDVSNLLKPTEVAFQLNVSRKTVYNWISTGVMESVRIGGCSRIKKDEVDRMKQEYA